MIGDILRRLRKEKGLTQQALADKMGVSRETIKMIEGHINKPSLELLEKLSDFFGVLPSYLMGGEVENKVKIKEKSQDSFTMELLEKLIDDGIIKDPNDIKEEELNLILAAVKMDIRRIKKDF